MLIQQFSMTLPSGWGTCENQKWLRVHSWTCKQQLKIMWYDLKLQNSYWMDLVVSVTEWKCNKLQSSSPLCNSGFLLKCVTSKPRPTLLNQCLNPVHIQYMSLKLFFQRLLESHRTNYLVVYRLSSAPHDYVRVSLHFLEAIFSLLILMTLSN